MNPPPKNAFAAMMAASSAGGKNQEKAKTHGVEQRDQPWVEKYRPKNLDQVSSQDHAVTVLKKTLQSANLPHLLFYGPPGTGKTSTILALCRQLFGVHFKSRVLELNASDERGISVVREKVRNFAKLAVGADKEERGADGRPLPPYKLIILDEADSMTSEAQSALRRIMEQYSKATRFCLCCNWVTRIIDPIVSRCSKFRFRSLDATSARSRLEHICSLEQVKIEDEALDTLLKVSSGDLRRAITYLQSASRLHGHVSPASINLTGEQSNEASESNMKAITVKSIQDIAGVVPDQVLQTFGTSLGIDLGLSEDDQMDVDQTTKNVAFEQVKQAVRQIVRSGFSAGQIIDQLQERLLESAAPLLSSKQKVLIAQILGEADKSLLDGASEDLCLLDVAASIWKVGKSE